MSQSLFPEFTLTDHLEENGPIHFFQVWLTSMFKKVITLRGLELYNNKFAKYTGFNKRKKAHLFDVESVANKGHYYKVSISEPNLSTLKYKCNCPYFKKNDECKHVAASMISLGFVLEKKEQAKVEKLVHKANHVFFSPMPKSLNKFINEGLYQGTFYRPRLELNSVSPENVKAIAFESAASYKKYRVQVTLENGWLLLKCTCGKTVSRLCDHQLGVLSEVSTTHGDDYFYKRQVSEEDKKRAAETLNFKTFEEADKYYKITFQDDGLTVETRDSQVAPPLIGEEYIDGIADFLKIPSLNTEIASVERTQPNCIILNSTEYDYYIAPATTTFNKKGGFSSKIKKLSSFNDDVLDRAFQRFIDVDAYFDDENEFAFVEALWKYRHELSKYPIFIDVGINSVLTKSNCLPINLASSRASLVIFEEKDDEFITLSQFIKLGNKSINPESNAIKRYSFFIEHKGELYPYLNYEIQAAIASGNIKMPIKILRVYEKEYYEKLAPKVLRESSIIKEDAQTLKASTIVKSVYLSEDKGHVLFSPTISYDDVNVPILDDNSVYWLNFKEGIALERDRQLEKDFKTLVEELNPDFVQQQNSHSFYLNHEQMLHNNWFATFSLSLKENEIAIYGQKDLKSFKYRLSSPSISMQIKSGIDWFDTDVELNYDGEVVPLKVLKQSILKGNKYVELKDGSLGILPEEWLAKLTTLFRVGKVDKESVKMPKVHFSALDLFVDEIDDFELMHELAEKKERLKNFVEVEKCQLPKQLNAILRNYQKEGLNWISFLHSYGFGGILADDMGLGKTIQVIAFLALQKELGNLKTSLVVAPRSLIYNWQNEIKKFYPNLNSVIHHGPDRATSISAYAAFDVVITTYGTLVNDVRFVKDYTFYYLILDESQSAKNYLSKRNKALRLLKANYKLGLTGTPIENNSLDVFAQMQLINPYLLGDITQFKNQFAIPIDRDGDKVRSAELQKILQPFILRRTKKQVATELPEKMETILTCEMTPMQRSLYNTTKTEIREGLLDGIDEKGIEKSSIMILSAMLKLRQICLSTALPKIEGDFGNESAKISALIEQLNDMPKGSKALVFSQFVQMLDLVKDALIENGIEYALLTGKTQKREVEIEKFKNNDDVKLFLISLKAGGTGLNLTEADYVFVLDPWWNPAVEAQAIDRAYRIGQEKKVFAYKMICKDSIEEKIIELQKKKIALADSVIQTDESSFKNLTRDDIVEIFS